jgi:hypothetical protein
VVRRRCLFLAVVLLLWSLLPYSAEHRKQIKKRQLRSFPLLLYHHAILTHNIFPIAPVHSSFTLSLFTLKQHRLGVLLLLSIVAIDYHLEQPQLDL